MPKYLLDTSYIIAHLAPDEDSTEIDKVFEEFYLGKIKLYVLPLTFYEVANSLKNLVKRNRINSTDTQKLFEIFTSFHFKIIQNDFPITLGLSINYDLSFYNAAYLEASKSRGMELLTLDSQLKKWQKSSRINLEQIFYNYP